MTTLHTQRYFLTHNSVWCSSVFSFWAAARESQEGKQFLVGGDGEFLAAMHREGGRDTSSPSFSPAPSTTRCHVEQPKIEGFLLLSPHQLQALALPALVRRRRGSVPRWDREPLPELGDPAPPDSRDGQQHSPSSALILLFPSEGVCFKHHLMPRTAAYAIAALKRPFKARFLRQS